MQVFGDSNGIIVLVQIIPHAEPHLLEQVIYIQKLYAGGMKYLLPSAYYFFCAVVVNML
jgi:hypothetical protein